MPQIIGVGKRILIFFNSLERLSNAKTCDRAACGRTVTTWSTSIDQNALYTCFKEYSTDPIDAPWTPWEPFDVPSNTVGPNSDISALKLPDGRLQLWYVSA